MGSIVRSTGYKALHRPVELASVIGNWPKTARRTPQVGEVISQLHQLDCANCVFRNLGNLGRVSLASLVLNRMSEIPLRLENSLRLDLTLRTPCKYFVRTPTDEQQDQSLIQALPACCVVPSSLSPCRTL